MQAYVFEEWADNVFEILENRQRLLKGAMVRLKKRNLGAAFNSMLRYTDISLSAKLLQRWVRGCFSRKKSNVFKGIVIAQEEDRHRRELEVLGRVVDKVSSLHASFWKSTQAAHLVMKPLAGIILHHKEMHLLRAALSGFDAKWRNKVSEIFQLCDPLLMSSIDVEPRLEMIAGLIRGGSATPPELLQILERRIRAYCRGENISVTMVDDDAPFAGVQDEKNVDEVVRLEESSSRSAGDGSIWKRRKGTERRKMKRITSNLRTGRGEEGYKEEKKRGRKRRRRRRRRKTTKKKKNNKKNKKTTWAKMSHYSPHASPP